MVCQRTLSEKFYVRDGHLLRKVGNKQWMAHEEVGSINHHGYLRTTFMGRELAVHRIIFCLYHGYMPEIVDHIDCNRTNNKIENLRDATSTLNNLNRNKASKNNKLGCLGVCIDKGKFKVQLSGKTIGRYETLEEAREVYISAKLARDEELT